MTSRYELNRNDRYKGYLVFDVLMRNVTSKTERMVTANSTDHLAMGYPEAKRYLAHTQSWAKQKHDISAFAKDIDLCERYCAIIDELREIDKNQNS